MPNLPAEAVQSIEKQFIINKKVHRAMCTVNLFIGILFYIPKRKFADNTGVLSYILNNPDHDVPDWRRIGG